MMKRISYLLLLLLCACAQPKQEETSIQKISVDVEKTTLFQFSSLFNKVNYTLLETNDTFLVGEVSRMKVVDDKVYFLANKRIVSFDTHTGKAFVQINRSGQSNEEYVSLFDMYIDNHSKQIELLDMVGKKINVYDFTGNYLQTIPLPFSSFSFTKSGESKYWLYNNNMESDSPYKLILYNAEKQTILNEHLPRDPHLATYFFILESNNFNPHAPKSTFIASPDHILYQIKEDGSLSPLYQIDFGKNQPPTSFFQNEYSDIADFSQKAIAAGYIYSIGSFVENEHYMAFSFRKDRPHWSFIDKSDNTAYTCDKFTDDVNGLEHSFPIEYENAPFTINGDHFYFVLQPSQLLDAFDALRSKMGEEKVNEFLMQNADLKRIIETTGFDEESNPILVTCRFKKK